MIRADRSTTAHWMEFWRRTPHRWRDILAGGWGTSYFGTYQTSTIGADSRRTVPSPPRDPLSIPGVHPPPVERARRKVQSAVARSIVPTGTATWCAPRVYAFTEPRCGTSGRGSQAGLLTGTGPILLKNSGRKGPYLLKTDSCLLPGRPAARYPLGRGPMGARASRGAGEGDEKRLAPRRSPAKAIHRARSPRAPFGVTVVRKDSHASRAVKTSPPWHWPGNRNGSLKLV